MGGRGMELEALWFVALWLLIFCSEFCKAFCKWWRNVEPNVCLSFHTLFSIFRRLFFQERWGGVGVTHNQQQTECERNPSLLTAFSQSQRKAGQVWAHLKHFCYRSWCDHYEHRLPKGGKRKGNREKRTSIAPAFNFPCRLAGYLPPHLLLQNLLSSPVPTALCTQSDAWLHATALLPILNPIPNAQEAPPGHHREGLI